LTPHHRGCAIAREIVEEAAMARAAWIVGVLIVLAAGGMRAARTVQGISGRAPARGLEISLTSLPEARVCDLAVAPAAWPDASSGWFFATGPTARHDEQELAAGVLAPLIDLRFVGGALRLFLLGSPVRTGLRFTTAGWRPRWPFC
jgi:hypothetical protein